MISKEEVRSTMVTTIVIRITSAAEDLNRDDDDDQLHHKKQCDDFDDGNGDYKNDTKNHGEEICLTDDEAEDGGFCDGRSQNDVSSHCKPNDDTIKDEGTAVNIRRHNNTSNKRPLLLEDADDDGKKKLGRKRQQVIDLAGIPPQPPIKSNRSDGSSKYQGVSFDKTHNNWRAQISVDGKTHCIGSYVNEEEAAIDYARAAYKYKAGIAGGKRKQKFIDLTDVPPQPPIKSKRSDSSSKYQGVTFNKIMNKWLAQIRIDGKQYTIGLYDNEEEAAIDYARAVFKYDEGKAYVKRRQGQKFIDLTDVPPQSLIKSKRSDSSSKYEGVTFNKIMNKWLARISVDGKTHDIGRYDNEEEAAIDYARAAYKYKAGIAGGEGMQKFIDLTDVPPQSPIKSKRSDSSSKYQGVSFDKTMNKWRARISVDGKTQYNIGSYDNEEEAAIDYARAAYKYKAGIAGGEGMQKFIDLTDVPPQSPIKSKRSDGSSKYQGVYFDKQAKKWQARISVDGKTHYIGRYDNEEEAAIDYARAVFKYDEGKAYVKRRQGQKFIDLTDVPTQSLIKSKRSDSSSKYEGVTFNKIMNKWLARISVDGKTHDIGRYDNEEEAAIDYARAAYKYKAGIAGGEGKQKFIDLTDVPPQSPIKSKRSDSSSKYEGVTFNKTLNKWRARISVDGKQYKIGSYVNGEEAAIDYARAAYKYKAGITTRRASLLATGSMAIPRSTGRLFFPCATVGVSSTGVERLAMKEAEIKSATDEVVAAAMAALHRHRGDAEEAHNTVDYGSDAPSDLKRHDTTPSSSQLDVMTKAFLERSIARTLQSRRESGLVGSMTAFLARIGSCDSQAVMADMGAKVDPKAKVLLAEEQERRASRQGRGGQAEHDVSKQCL